MLDYVALFLLCFVVLVLFYGIIAIHDIPYDIAKKRNHPQQDAIQVAGWISLLTLHVLWPFLWIWATLYRQDRGWGFNTNTADSGQAGDGPGDRAEIYEQLEAMRSRIDDLERQLHQAPSPGPAAALESSAATLEPTVSKAPPADQSGEA